MDPKVKEAMKEHQEMESKEVKEKLKNDGELQDNAVNMMVAIRANF